MAQNIHFIHLSSPGTLALTRNGASHAERRFFHDMQTNRVCFGKPSETTVLLPAVSQSVSTFIAGSNLTTSCVYVNVGYCMKTCQLLMKCFNLSEFILGGFKFKRQNDKMLRSTKEIVMHIYL